MLESARHGNSLLRQIARRSRQDFFPKHSPRLLRRAWPGIPLLEQAATSSFGGTNNSSCEGMFTGSFHAGRQRVTASLLNLVSGTIVLNASLGPPSASLSCRSPACPLWPIVQRFRIRTSTPTDAPRPTATSIDIGVARPSAQGQAMMSTATAATNACASRGCGPQIDHPRMPAARPTRPRERNNRRLCQPAVASARGCAGLRLPTSQFAPAEFRFQRVRPSSRSSRGIKCASRDCIATAFRPAAVHQ